MTLARARAVNPYDYLPPKATFRLTSDDVVDGEQMAGTFALDSAGGDNESPQLSWSGFPSDTRSFAVTCFDPDAPVPSGFWHWVVVNIPASVTDLARNSGRSNSTLPPDAFHIRSDLGTLSYIGAAPPPGDHSHRYIFTVHAVDVPALDIDETATPAFAGFDLAFHTLARGSIAPTFTRSEGREDS
jgi:Raf kinase inhibitor-like YbhB/YbcL family protein